MKLYTYDPAPNPLRLALFLKYKGIELDTQQVDLMGGEQLTEEYLSIVPAGTVPALVLDDGTVLTEVIGICAYLEALYPEKPLLGTTPLEKAQVLGWDHRLFNTLVMAIAEVFRNGNPAFENRALPGPLNLAQIPELVERGQKMLDFGWPEMDRVLEGKTWLAGDNFSFADIDMLAIVNFSNWIKSTPPESCTHIHSYIARANEAMA